MSESGGRPPGSAPPSSTLIGMGRVEEDEPAPAQAHAQPVQPYDASGATTAPAHYPPPYSGPTPVHYSGPATAPTGYAGSGPHVPPPPAPAPYHAPPFVQGPQSEYDQVPGSEFVKFLKISSRRAFRLRIEPSEVLADEREQLVTATPPVHDLNLQAFLAWRRSVLFLVACALVPLALIGLIGAFSNMRFKAIFLVKLAPALAEALFCWLCWSQLKRWAHWRTQRRWLYWGWLVFMLTPFIVFVYPLRTFFSELQSISRSNAAAAWVALGFEGIRGAVQPFMLSMLAMLQLAPKAISLMPGLIRASMVIKLLFPGVSAPGWLIVIAAPLYALLVYVILIIPYQFTGSGWFIIGILGLVIGQAVLARAGFSLATPLTEDEALRRIKRVRSLYLTVMVFSAVMIVVALGSLVTQLRLHWSDVVTAVLKFEANVLILTMIISDLVVTNLDRARRQTAGRSHVEEATELKIAAFVSLEAPRAPPPPGPAMPPR